MLCSSSDTGVLVGAVITAYASQSSFAGYHSSGFSKKVENHAAMVSLHFMHYNFARAHSALGKQTTPAMAAGVADHVWTVQEIAALLD